jgi:hypothetical protein
MKASFKLPNHKNCRVDGRQILVGRTVFQTEDMIAMIRVFFTYSPLIARDTRLALIEELRAAVVMEQPSGRKWITFPLASEQC